jgi:catechol 2,3-dioxygenase-like lactoylglutathione lyase family enzyme
MIKTYGLTHLSISVADIDRSALFYEDLFGARRIYANDRFIQLQTPGSHDVIVLDKSNSDNDSVNNTGIKHFGFRLMNLTDVSLLVTEIEKTGGTIKEAGEFCPRGAICLLL